MSATCVAPAALDDISSLLSGVDCRIAQYVEAAYAGLFGPFGWLAPTLTAALTIYVAIYAYQVMAGRGSLTVSTLARRLIAIGAVVAFSSNWAAYQTVFVNFLSGGGEEIAAMILRATSGAAAATIDVGARLDALFDALTDLASGWGRSAPLSSVEAMAGAAVLEPAPLKFTAASAINMLWFSALALAISSAGVIVIAKIALGFLLALGPVFIVLALFPSTRGLFEGWLRAAAVNAFLPLFALLATAGMLPIVEPIVASIAEQQELGVNDNQPVFVLAIASLIFAALIGYCVIMTGKLAGAWRLPTSLERSEARVDADAASAPQGAVNPRIAGMIAAIGRDAAPAGSAPEAWRPRGVETLFLAHAPAPPAENFAARRVSYRGFGAARRAAP